MASPSRSCDIRGPAAPPGPTRRSAASASSTAAQTPFITVYSCSSPNASRKESRCSDPNNDGNSSTDRPPGVGRNSFEGPNLMTADLRISKDIGLWERAKLRLVFEGFNITNRANYNSLLTTQYVFNAATRAFTTAAGFLTPTTTFDPRILQLAATLTF